MATGYGLQKAAAALEPSRTTAGEKSPDSTIEGEGQSLEAPDMGTMSIAEELVKLLKLEDKLGVLLLEES